MIWMLQGITAVLPAGAHTKLETVDIVIRDDKIQAVGKNLDSVVYGVSEILSGQNKLAIPGLVNAHLHSHDRFDKGRFDNLPLEIWMSLYNPPFENRNWTARQVYLRTLLNGIELLRSGTTTVIDDVHHGATLSEESVSAVCQAYTDLGLRAQVSAAYSDKPFYRGIPFLEEMLPAELKHNPSTGRSLSSSAVLDLWSTLAETWKGQVQFVLSPSGPQRSTGDFLRLTWQLAEKHSIPVIVHLLETRIQAYTGYAFYGKSLVEYMQSLGVLSPWSTLIHTVWVNERDIELIANSGASVVHCPGSNLKLGSGIAPVQRLRRAGIRVGLGTDNNNANDSANMFETMKLAALIHKVNDSDFEGWLGAEDAFQMATEGGAQAGHLQDQIGTIEAGKQADLVLLDLNSLPLFPPNNLLNQLVYAEHGESIETVIVAGRVVMDKGRVTTIDEPAVMAEIREEAPLIRQNIERTVAAGKRLEPYLKSAYLKCMQESTFLAKK